VLGEAATKVMLEGAPNVLGERARVVLFGEAQKRAEVLAHDRVQHGALGPMPPVGATLDGDARHDARMAKRVPRPIATDHHESQGILDAEHRRRPASAGDSAGAGPAGGTRRRLRLDPQTSASGPPGAR